MSNTFLQGRRKIFQGGFAPLVTGLPVYNNLIDSHRRVDEIVSVGDCRINRLLFADGLVRGYGSSQQGLQHAFDRFFAACNQAGTKISSKKIEVLCPFQGSVKTSKAVFSASERKFPATGGYVPGPWGDVYE